MSKALADKSDLQSGFSMQNPIKHLLLDNFICEGNFVSPRLVIILNIIRMQNVNIKTFPFYLFFLSTAFIFINLTFWQMDQSYYDARRAR